MTLRELFWAARAKQTDEWDRTASLMSWFARKMTGDKIHPDNLNPMRIRTKTAEEKRVEHKEGMRALKMGLKLIAGGR